MASHILSFGGLTLLRWQGYDRLYNAGLDAKPLFSQVAGLSGAAAA